jgi:hypothetical protein
MSRLILSAIISIVLIVVAIGVFFFVKYSDLGEASFDRTELSFPGKPQLYIKIKSWGVSADSQVTVITTDPETKFKVDSTEQIVFNDLEPFLYQQRNDTLILCVRRKATVPPGFNHQWTIIQHEVDNSEWTKRRRDYRYKKI